MPSQRELKHQLELNERKLLFADAVLHEAAQVAECAKEKIAAGDEWQGNLLIDATARILNTYTMSDEQQ